MEWSSFYATMATGLLFVAAQLSADRIAGDRRDRWWAIAFSTFYNFLTVFVLPLSYLSPALRPHGRAVLTLVPALIHIGRIGQTSLVIWHGMSRRQGDGLWETLWNLIGPSILYTLLGYHAATTLLGGPADIMDDKNATLLVILFVLALRNSWRLVVEGVFHKR